MWENFHPGYFLIIGAIAVFLSPRRLQKVIMMAFPLLALWFSFNLEVGIVRNLDFINEMTLEYLRTDKLAWIFSFILSLMTVIISIYSLNISKKGEIVASLLYAGSSISVVLAGDWLTLIIFWELMSVSSVFLIWYGNTAKSLKAGFRYLLVHLLGGNLLLAGILLSVFKGQLSIEPIIGTYDMSSWLILAGIGINAAIVPLHAWLTDAYPEATITGTIFMNTLTTKVAVYCLIRVFPGSSILLWMGIIMAFYGVIYAVLENNIRRLLSYHVISQLGLIIAAVGIGTELAINGAAALTIGNIIYKSLLFMSAGAVIYSTGLTKLTELSGIYKKMPLNTFFFTVGALAISGVPLLNGFTSKSMVISAAAYNHMGTVELLLYLASIGTFLSIALKLEYFMFFGEDKGIITKKIPVSMYVAMAGLSLLCFIYGVFPESLYQKLPYVVEYEPYTLDHIVSNLQLLAAAFIPFWFLLPKLKTKNKLSLDTDWFYRVPFAAFVTGVVNLVCGIRDWFGTAGNELLRAVVSQFANPLKWVTPNTGEQNIAVYQEDMYRFPVGLTVLLSLVIFIITVSYIWIF